MTLITRAGLAGMPSSMAFFEAKPLRYAYVTVMVFVYIVVLVHTPMSIYPTAEVDDGLFIKAGQRLVDGQWLGAYDKYTLAKGPGYSMFLAFANLIGISIALAQAIFYCFATTFFVYVVHRAIKLYLISSLLLAFILWHPISLLSRRVIRDQIYAGQVLIIIATIALALFGPKSRACRVFWAFFAGCALGWFWLTREEGIWIVPALAVLVAAAATEAYRSGALRSFFGVLVVLLGTFTLTQAGFRTVNWAVYGSFVGVDFKEANFQRALGAIHSVRSGGTMPKVSATFAALQRISAVSPAFASISEFFRPDSDLVRITCEVQPESCGQLAAGWFMWLLRDAAAARGNYASPAAASSFFGRMADEISGACANGALACMPQLLPEMPPWTWQQVADGFWERSGEVIRKLVLRDPQSSIGPSTGDTQVFGSTLRFLNYPFHRPSMDMPNSYPVYVLKGWYYRVGALWMSITADASPTPVRLERRLSTDLVSQFKDPLAFFQRFIAWIPCLDDCLISFADVGGPVTAKRLGALKVGTLRSPNGKGQVYIESIESLAGEAASAPSRLDRVASRVRLAVIQYYPVLLVPLIVFGLVAFLVAPLIRLRATLRNIAYLLAFVCWLAVATRVVLLTLIAVTAFPALDVLYLTPVYPMLVAGAVLSITALTQLLGPQPASWREGAPPRETV